MNEETELLQAVQREPVVKHVHRELRRAILQGRFPPQSRLVETSLAQLLNVSRTPVREAISKLESEGLVRRLRGGGVVVEDTSGKLSEVIILRQGLEGAAVRLACQRASDADIAALEQACEEARATVQSSSVQTRSALDRAFHMQLGVMSQSPRLAGLIEEFYEYSYSELAPGGSAADIDLLQTQHIAITRALKARDAVAAEQSVREHLDTVLRIVRGRLGD
jgi:DNA-binding GntR family transcriptional regulator